MYDRNATSPTTLRPGARTLAYRLVDGDFVPMAIHFHLGNVQVVRAFQLDPESTITHANTVRPLTPIVACANGRSIYALDHAPHISTNSLGGKHERRLAHLLRATHGVRGASQ